MNWASGGIVDTLKFLLPGFVSAAIFHSFTSHSKPGEFGLVVQALIFTIVGEAVITALLLMDSFAWMKGRGVVLSVPVAVLLGLVAAYFSNNDTVHRLFRRLGVTRETSYPSEWYSTFARTDCYVVLHLKGERRLYGWPEEWPSRPDEGHFRITEGEWLFETGTEDEYQKKMPATEISAILIPVGEVEMVEFVSASPDEETEE